MLSILLIGDDSSHMDDLLQLLGVELAPVIYHPVSAIDELSYNEVADFALIILCPGNLFPHFGFETQSLLSRFVRAGGVLLAMPFTAWSVRNKANHLLGDVLPVSGESFFESCSVRWRWTDARTRFLEEMPSAGEAIISGEFLKCKPDAQSLAVAEVRFGNEVLDTPLASTIQLEQGTSVYLNISYHSHEGDDIRIWEPGSSDSLYFPFVTMLMGLLRAVLLQAQSGGASSHYADMPPLLSHRGLDTHIISSLLAHGAIRGYRHGEHSYMLLVKSTDPITAMFLDEDTYRSMSQSERILVCRKSISMLYSAATDSRGESGLSLNSNQRGRALELFAKYFLELQPGIHVIRERGRRENLEIDLLVRNEAQHPFWRSLGSPMAVECRNYRAKIGSDQIRDFSSKMRELSIKTGFLISLEGVTGKEGSGARRTIQEQHRDGNTIIPLDRHDIDDALRELTPTRVIRRSYESLFL